MKAKNIEKNVKNVEDEVIVVDEATEEVATEEEKDMIEVTEEVATEEKKPGFFKRVKNKASKVYNEGVKLPPFKDVVKGTVKVAAIAAAGAGAAMLVLTKLGNNDQDGEFDDSYTSGEEGSSDEINAVLQIPVEIGVSEDVAEADVE